MKNLVFIIFLFFVYGCGYTSVYKDSRSQDFQIIITEMKGDIEINNLLKNQINLYSNENSTDKFNIAVHSTSGSKILTKNSSGVTTNYNLSVSSKFVINIGEKTHVRNFNENINIKSQSDVFEKNLYEKNVKRNFASSIREKLISEIINLR